jgi:hypothetical protein
MPEPVPVASNLLESRFLGFSVRRLLESMAIPVAPCAILYTVGFPLLVTFPLFVAGIGIGVFIFLKTPPGQRPLRYAHAFARRRSGENVYTWAPSAELENVLASGRRQDTWLTRPPDSHTTIDRCEQRGVVIGSAGLHRADHRSKSDADEGAR